MRKGITKGGTKPFYSQIVQRNDCLPTRHYHSGTIGLFQAIHRYQGFETSHLNRVQSLENSYTNNNILRKDTQYQSPGTSPEPVDDGIFF